jgi:hypothetical protein
MFDVLKQRYERNAPQQGDLTAAINELISSGGAVQQFTLSTEYININYEEDIHSARSIVRRSRLETARVSLVMPCESSHAVIDDMLRMARRQARVAEVLLVTRQSDPDLARLASVYQAKLITAAGLSRRAFGDLFRAGIAQASGDVIVMTMDDESFDPGDIGKLLAYMGEADLVLGTRTTSQLVQQGSNLNWLARTGNYALAKFIEAVWPGRRVRLTDVGCVFRAFWRDSWDQIAPEVRSHGPAFAPEMIVEALRRRLWVVEIPINYCRASEESRVRVEHRNFRVFLSMAGMILGKRFHRSRSDSKARSPMGSEAVIR